METELQKLESPAKIITENNGGSNRESNSNEPKYTSLKDIIPSSPTHDSINPEQNGFSSSNISIRNQLVKQAASAYLQSAAILASRNQNCVARLWRQLESKVIFHSWWRIYVRNPLKACISPISHFMAYVFNQIRSIWRGHVSIARNTCD